MTLAAHMAECERQYLLELLSRHRTVKACADEAGLLRTSIYKRFHRHGIEPYAVITGGNISRYTRTAQEHATL